MSEHHRLDEGMSGTVCRRTRTKKAPEDGYSHLIVLGASRLLQEHQFRVRQFRRLHEEGCMPGTRSCICSLPSHKEGCRRVQTTSRIEHSLEKSWFGQGSYRPHTPPCQCLAVWVVHEQF
ncbi:hypothetical protein CEXT_713711 [Caerostris extrusa]|uniref:Uncharacterized protein n=1 Tax=Caerostris extrusa TaxID=172846 RepID=A0AAV4PFB9_CAEEX|nr:hypothetical protein CEXT_713711 [Caerostris extrusa]